jgi:disulfide bond formation protein DsbB
MQNNKISYLLVLFLSLAALSLAYMFQFIGYAPCKLCMYQRIPYFILVPLSILGLWQKTGHCYIKIAITVILTAEILMAGFHTGVEHGIFTLKMSCNSAASSATDVEQFRKLLETAPIAACDKPTLFILGLSITAWNLLYSTFFLITYLVLVYENAKKNAK